MHEILSWLFAQPAQPTVHSLATFYAHNEARSQQFRLPFDAAVAGGHAADRFAYAFAAGYAQALRRLVTGVPCAPATAQGRVALCITESGGNHPRAIRTALHRHGADLSVSGQKSFVTFGSEAETLLVAVVDGEDDVARPRIRILAVPASRSGVHLEPIAETPFVPEIPHAALTLENVAVNEAELLEGDGYARYVKPFRTIEDIHVFGAVLGYALRMARLHDGDASVRERGLAQVAALRQLADGPFDEPALHLALAGILSGAEEVLTQVRKLLDAAPIPCDASVVSRWDRDALLMSVAKRARAQRRVVAWERLVAGTD